MCPKKTSYASQQYWPPRFFGKATIKTKFYKSFLFINQQTGHAQTDHK